jgi:predicted acylesterase/phospholipase RssA
MDEFIARWRLEGGPPVGGGAFRPTFRNITRVLAERGAAATVLGGSAAGARLGSLITASWNQLVEWLKRLKTLRECVKTGQENHPSR